MFIKNIIKAITGSRWKIADPEEELVERFEGKGKHQDGSGDSMETEQPKIMKKEGKKKKMVEMAEPTEEQLENKNR